MDLRIPLRNNFTRTLIKIPRKIYYDARRSHFQNSVSSPFLSGDLFADSSDASIYESRSKRIQPSRKQIANAQVIFCPSHRMEDFLEEYKGAIFAKVLIFGNSDRDFEGFDANLPRRVKRVFLQNAYFQDEIFEPLPIGIENLRHARNGLPRLFDPEYVTIKKNRKVLIGPFGMNHPERHFIDQMSSGRDGYFDVRVDRISPRRYAELSATYKYVASPRGNGIDTHRFWEALYRGSIPVVKFSKWSECISIHNIPLVGISDWTKSELVRVVESEDFSTPIDPKLIPALWWPYWKRRIAESF